MRPSWHDSPQGRSVNPETDPEPNANVEGLRQRFADLPNAELLTALDVVLLELEKRLLHYARLGPDLLEMADEGLVLAVRAGARLTQAQSSASHAAGHLQVVGVGSWTPTSTKPSWSQDPRITGEGHAGENAG
jgi:hypothetical protein